MQSVLNQKNKCCAKRCCKNFSLPELEEVADLWHNLSQNEQMQFICSQHEVHDTDASTTVEHKSLTDWELCGKRVCVSGLCSLLGIGERSLYKKLNHAVDLRKKWAENSWRPNRRVQRDPVDMFFMELYQY